MNTQGTNVNSSSNWGFRVIGIEICSNLSEGTRKRDRNVHGFRTMEVRLYTFFFSDFSETFSNKTLEQYPSPLYRYRYKNNNPDHNLDSDSGYSSPLHRKNQVCSGTQSDSIQPWVMTLNSVQSDDPSIVHAATVPQQKFSYAFIAQKEPSPKPVINVDNQKTDVRENCKERKQKPVDRNNLNSGSANNRRDKNYDKRSHVSQDFRSSNQNTSAYDLNNPHINRNVNKKFVGEKNQDELQSKGFQGRKQGQKHMNDSDETARGGYSRKGSAKQEENEYGFSRTKNLNLERQGDKRNVQESKFGKNLPKHGQVKQNVKKDEIKESEMANNETETETGEPGKKKRRRRRRRKKKNKEGDQDSQEEGEPVPKQEVELHFEDVEEFPDLSSAKVSDPTSPVILMSYSAMLQTVSHMVLLHCKTE